MQRDVFRGQAAKSKPMTQALGRAPGTAPLPAGRAPTDALAGQAIHRVLQLLREALGRHQPVIELLYVACEQVPIPIPGVGQVALVHQRTSKGDQIVLYLVRELRGQAALPRRVQVAIFRFYDAEAGAEQGETLVAGLEPISEAFVEQLRRRLFFLMHFHAEFADEPVLAQLFPGPGAPKAATPPASAAERLRRKSRLQAVLGKAEVLYHHVAPTIAAIEGFMRALAAPPGFLVKDLLSPETRMARLLAFRLGEDPAARALMAKAVRDHAALKAALDQAKETQDPAGVEEAAFPLSGLLAAMRQHPALRELVKPPPAG